MKDEDISDSKLIISAKACDGCAGCAMVVAVYDDGESVVLARYSAETDISVVSSSAHEAMKQAIAECRAECRDEVELEHEDECTNPSWDEILRKAQGE